MSRFRLVLCIAFSVVITDNAAFTQTAGFATACYYDDPGTGPKEHPVDMLRMKIEVSFVPEQGLVRGRVTHTFAPLRPEVDSLFFNGPGIRVSQVLLDGRPVRHEVSPDGITLFPNKPLHWDEIDSTEFVYEATPRRGLYFIGWNDARGISRKQIWTQGQGIDNRNWVPCYDEQNDKLITETVVTFDSAYQVISNGELLSRIGHRDGTATWHYRLSRSQSSYLVMLAIGKYGIETRRSRSGVPLRLYYYPDLPDRVEPTYRYSADMVDFMEKETGVPFPWKSYSQIPVQNFLYGAMENTTATVFGDFYLVDRRAFLDRNYIDVNAHELAHQWFGDYVTGRAGKNAWLHESFATFYAKLFMRHVYGEDMYEWMRRQEQDAALAASKQNHLPLTHSQAGSARVYQKGSAVLDMMTYVFGEAEFQRVVSKYLTAHAYGLVETNDLYQAFQDTLGITPDWFFDEWIYRGGEPHYDVHYQDVRDARDGRRQTEVTVRQMQPVNSLEKLFRMPVVIDVHYADGTFDHVREMIEGESRFVVVPNPGGKTISFVLFDPGSHILKSVTFRKSFAELREQALHAPHFIDRYDAVVSLCASEDPATLGVLSQVYDREKFYPIRAAIVSHCAADTGDLARSLLLRALRDPSAEVRHAALDATRRIPEPLRPDYEALLRDSSYAIEAAALEKLADQFSDRAKGYLEITRRDRGVGNEVRVTWHLVNVLNGDSSSAAALMDLCTSSYEFRTRVNALGSLKKLNILREQMIPALFDAMLSANNRLSGPAREVTAYFRQQLRYRAMLTRYLDSHSWDPWQSAILEAAVR